MMSPDLSWRLERPSELSRRRNQTSGSTNWAEPSDIKRTLPLEVLLRSSGLRLPRPPAEPEQEPLGAWGHMGSVHMDAARDSRGTPWRQGTGRGVGSLNDSFRIPMSQTMALLISMEAPDDRTSSEGSGHSLSDP